MSTTLIIYHNPQCSKSRNALKFLEDNQEKHGYQVETVLYKKTPLDREQLETLVKFLGLKDADSGLLLRPEVKNQASSLKEAIDLIVSEPQHFERPFVVDQKNKKAALGRPDLSDIQRLVENL
ncbi:hypothetical protein BY458DRAFT_530779 [Sporodiniella umbellata]|nr:hypothetical protein BY458DRAFT_530779 [Sporodiniella umbellata]